jgi:hypothetical protein
MRYRHRGLQGEEGAAVSGRTWAIAMRIGRGSTVEIGDWILFDSGDISPL